jgi:hypothetical protein
VAQRKEEQVDRKQRKAKKNKDKQRDKNIEKVRKSK